MCTPNNKWINTKAPYRIDLSGGPTDILDFARDDPGYIVSLAIDRYAYSYVRELEKPDELRLNSLDFGISEQYEKFNLQSNGLGQANPKLHLLLACILIADNRKGLEVVTKSDFAPNSGLGGSASLAVSLLGAIQLVNGRKFSPNDLAKAALDVENHILKNTAGGQDQYSSAIGGISSFVFDGPQINQTSIHLSDKIYDQLSKSFLICGPFSSHNSGDILDYVVNRYRENNASVKYGLAQLRKIAKILPEVLQSGDLLSLGEALDRNRAAQSLLSPYIPNKDFNNVLESCRKIGVLGGKLSGAGGGGYGILLVHPNKRIDVHKHLKSLGVYSFAVGIDRVGFS